MGVTSEPPGRPRVHMTELLQRVPARSAIMRNSVFISNPEREVNRPIAMFFTKGA